MGWGQGWAKFSDSQGQGGRDGVAAAQLNQMVAASVSVQEAVPGHPQVSQLQCPPPASASTSTQAWTESPSVPEDLFDVGILLKGSDGSLSEFLVVGVLEKFCDS